MLTTLENMDHDALPLNQTFVEKKKNRGKCIFCKPFKFNHQNTVDSDFVKCSYLLLADVIFGTKDKSSEFVSQLH